LAVLLLILAIDTTTPRGSVALTRDDQILGEVRLADAAGLGHSSRVLPAVEFLLGSLGLDPGAVEAYAVATGPGSFTGSRVGIATVQGMALAAGRSCLGISSLDLLAARVRGSADRLVAMMDAYRGEVFAATYDREARLDGQRVVEEPDSFLRRLPGAAAFVGDGAERYRSEVLALCPGASFPERSLFLAGTLGRVAQARLEAGDGLAPEDLRPYYLREAPVKQGRP
jgi:tRNA threonylcarbamoyladenosine biosynthesis protein TsaB